MKGSALLQKKTDGRYGEFRQVAVFIGVLLVVRFLFLCMSPLELSPDEAYYWDWSRRLSLGYYSKPPMVAWLMALSTSILSTSEFAVRFPAVILNVLTAVAIYLTGRKMSGHKTGFLASLAYCSTIGAAVAGYIMTIDAPLLCFWALTLFFLWLAVERSIQEEGASHSGLWIVSGIFCGLGLLSKQTMIALSGAMALFFWATNHGRNLLRQRGPYLFYAFQLLLLSPFLWWNYKHNWITFLHTAHHFEQAEKTSLLRVDTFLELLGTQAGLITPLLYVVLMAGAVCIVWAAITKSRYLGALESRKLLLVTILSFSGLLPLLSVFLLSFKQRINANWPAPFYISLSLLLGLWLSGFLQKGQGRRCQQIKGLFRPAVATGLILVATLYVLPFVFTYTSLSGSSFDPTVRLRGWRQLAQETDGLLSSVPRKDKTIIVARRRQTVSELAFYMKDHPVVYRWNGFERRIKSQYELWPGPVDKMGWDALVVVAANKKLDGLERCFHSFSLLKQINIDLGGTRKRIFNVYLGQGLSKWARR